MILPAGIPCAKSISAQGFPAWNQFPCRDSMRLINFCSGILCMESTSLQGFPAPNKFPRRESLPGNMQTLEYLQEKLGKNLNCFNIRIRAQGGRIP